MGLGVLFATYYIGMTNKGIVASGFRRIRIWEVAFRVATLIA